MGAGADPFFDCKGSLKVTFMGPPCRTSSRAWCVPIKAVLKRKGFAQPKPLRSENVPLRSSFFCEALLFTRCYKQIYYMLFVQEYARRLPRAVLWSSLRAPLAVSRGSQRGSNGLALCQAFAFSIAMRVCSAARRRRRSRPVFLQILVCLLSA